MKLASTFNVSLVVVTDSPAVGVNCTSICVMERPVAYPVTSSVTPLAVLLDTCTLNRRGADCGTVRLSAGGREGVNTIPPSDTNDGVSVMVPATVPVCSPICVELFGNTA